MSEATDKQFLDELERDLDKPVVAASASEEELASEDDVPLEEQVTHLRQEAHQLMVLLSRTNEEAEIEKQRVNEEWERQVAKLKSLHANEVDQLQRQIEETRLLGLEMSKKAEGEAAAASRSADIIAALQSELLAVKTKLREETDKLNTEIQRREKLEQEWAQEKQRLSRAASPQKEAPVVPEKSKKRAEAAPSSSPTTTVAEAHPTSSSSATSASATATAPTTPTIAVTIPKSSSNTVLLTADSPTDSPKNSKPVAGSPSSSALSKRESSSPMSPAGPNACLVCGKTVFPMDKLSVDGRVLHKVCFRCSHCNSKLSGTNFCFYKEKAFCKAHFMQLFKLKGSYNDLE